MNYFEALLRQMVREVVKEVLAEGSVAPAPVVKAVAPPPPPPMADGTHPGAPKGYGMPASLPFRTERPSAPPMSPPLLHRDGTLCERQPIPKTVKEAREGKLSNGAELCVVQECTITEPTASSKHRYLNVKVMSFDGRYLMVRFYLNSKTQDAEWQQLFWDFCHYTNAGDVHDATKDLPNREIYLHMPLPDVHTVAGLIGASALMGGKIGSEE